MFSRKKSIWERKEVYAGVAVAALAVFSLSLLFDTPEEAIIEIEDSGDTTQSVVKKESTSKSSDYTDNIYGDIEEKKDDNIEDEQQDILDGEYYLIREENGLIKIYQCDEDGEEKLMRTTDISYSLLYDDDQRMFSEGVKVYTEDEVMELLQDFES